MRAAFDDFAVFQDDNLVSLHHGGEPVRDHERCAARHQALNGVLNVRFAFGVEARGCFI